MGTEPWKGQEKVAQGDTCPATFVNWYYSVEFCRKLSEREERSYRLPSEAEWEYACRAGTPSRFSFGDDAARLSDYAWWGGIVGDGSAKDEKYAHAVAQKLPNSFGLHDMCGNVWEWCNDTYDAKFYTTVAESNSDPRGPEKEGTNRVIRGGAWHNMAHVCRSASRFKYEPGIRESHQGFRVILEVNPRISQKYKHIDAPPTTD